MATERHFETALRELKAQLLSMAGLVEKSIEHATDALTRQTAADLVRVHELETLVNQAHKRVDSGCINLLALHQPMAADLRLIVAIIKINTDLERMGDQAVNIAWNAEKYIQSQKRAGPLGELVDTPEMSRLVRIMVRDSLDSFVRRDQSMARRVLEMDDAVDALKRAVFDDAVRIMKEKPAQIDQGLALILIARNLERLGDHATNIAEDVIYAISGEDVRHSGSAPTAAAKGAEGI